jgi:hypothetical protein
VLVSFRARVDETFLDHLDVLALVDANLIATNTADFIPVALIFVFTVDAALVTAQDFPFTKLLILPEFPFTGRAFDG